MKKGRFIGDEEQVFVHFDSPEGQVLQTTMGEYRRYWSLLGWKLMGPAAMMIEAEELGCWSI